MTIIPMCSVSLSPMFFHDLPPSTDLYTPSPNDTLRWLLFSPVPTQTMLWLLGSISTQPIENEPWLSKTGVNVVPLFTVFHTPPELTATNHSLWLSGLTAKSPIRPDRSAGPIERAFITEEKVDAEMRSETSGDASSGCSAGWSVGCSAGWSTG